MGYLPREDLSVKWRCSLGMKLLDYKEVYIANDAILTMQIILQSCFLLYFKYSNKCTTFSRSLTLLISKVPLTYYISMVLYNPTSPTTVLTTVSFPFTFAPYPSSDPLRTCTIFWLEILIQFIKINYVYCAPGRLQRYTGKCDRVKLLSSQSIQ